MFNKKNLLWLLITSIGWVILSYFLAGYFFSRVDIVYSERLQQIYETLKNHGYRLPASLDVFAQDMTDSAKARRVYKTMIEDDIALVIPENKIIDNYGYHEQKYNTLKLDIFIDQFYSKYSPNDIPRGEQRERLKEKLRGNFDGYVGQMYTKYAPGNKPDSARLASLRSKYLVIQLAAQTSSVSYLSYDQFHSDIQPQRFTTLNKELFFILLLIGTAGIIVYVIYLMFAKRRFLLLGLLTISIGWVILSYSLAENLFRDEYYSSFRKQHVSYFNDRLFSALLLIGAAGILFYLGALLLKQKKQAKK